MENRFLNKLKDPLFRMEIYEYLMQKVLDRIDILQNHPKTKLRTSADVGFTGYMCINMFLKFKSEPDFIEPSGCGDTDSTALHIMLPELIRPTNISSLTFAWFCDDIKGNMQRLECLKNALNLVAEKIVHVNN